MNQSTAATAAPPGAAPRGRKRRAALALVVAAIVLVILIVMFFLGRASGSRYEKYLGGLWVGDPGFLEQAQLRDMQLFLAPAESGSRQGYLIMTDMNGEFISNQAIEVRVGSGASRWWTALRSVFVSERDAYKASDVEIEYDDARAAGEPPMPSRMKMSLSILDGTLTLYDTEKVYAFLEKDLVASAAAIEAYAS